MGPASIVSSCMKNNAEQQSNTKANYTGEIPNTPLRFLWFATKPYWKWFVLGVLCTLVAQILATYIAIYIGNFATAAQNDLTARAFTSWAWWFVVLNFFFFAAF